MSGHTVNASAPMRVLLAQEPRLLLDNDPAARMKMAERKQSTALLSRLAATRAVVDMTWISETA